MILYKDKLKLNNEYKSINKVIFYKCFAVEQQQFEHL